MDRAEITYRIEDLPQLSPDPLVLRAVVTSLCETPPNPERAWQFIQSEPVLFLECLRLEPDRALAGADAPTEFSGRHGAARLARLRSGLAALTVAAPVPDAVLRHLRDLADHALLCACWAEALAGRYERLDKGEAYAAGLLHDIGKHVLAECDWPLYQRALELRRRERIPLGQAEKRMFGINHPLAGKRFAEAWALPARITHAIWLHHHSPESLRDSGFPADLIACVHAANQLSQDPDEPMGVVQQALLERLGYRASETHQLIDSVASRFAMRRAMIEEARHSAFEIAPGELLERLSRLEAENSDLRIETRRLAARQELASSALRDPALTSLVKGIATLLRDDFGIQPGVLCMFEREDRLVGASWKSGSSTIQTWRADLETLAEGGTAGDLPLVNALNSLYLSASGRAWEGRLFETTILRNGLVAVPLLDGARNHGQLLFETESFHGAPSESLIAEISSFTAHVAAILTQWHEKTRMRDQIEQLGDALERVRERQTEGAAAAGPDWGAITEGAATAMNAPLSMIAAQAQWLRSRVPDAAMGRSLDAILHHSRRAKKLVQDLQTLCRPIRPRREPCLVNSVVHASVAAMHDRLEPKRIRVIENFVEGLPRVVADRRLIEQAIAGILSAREEAMSATGGTIAISTRLLEDRKRVEIRISDTGPALQLIQPGPNPASTRHVVGGADLGVAVSREIVAAQDGGFEVLDSAVGGATFSITLPTAAPAVLESGSNAGRRARAPIPNRAPVESHQRVLVVDDDENVREVLKHTLRMRGYRVRTASNSVDALSTAGEASCHLILLDVALGEDDGLALLSRIQERHPGTPVLAMLDAASEHLERAVMTRGAKFCLKKPFEVKRLLEEVDHLLGRRVPAPRPSPYSSAQGDASP